MKQEGELQIFLTQLLMEHRERYTHFVLTKHAMLATFVHEIAVPSPGHLSETDDARYWLKHVLHSGQGSI